MNHEASYDVVLSKQLLPRRSLIFRSVGYLGSRSVSVAIVRHVAVGYDSRHERMTELPSMLTEIVLLLTSSQDQCQQSDQDCAA
jgi:hypothetical protein